MNPELKMQIGSVGGGYFKPDQIKEIIDKITQDSIRIEKDYKFYRWPFVILALIIFLIELAFRRYRETKLYGQN